MTSGLGYRSVPLAPAGTLIAIPFLAEDPELASRTLLEARAHPAVTRVVGIHGDRIDVAAAVSARVGSVPGIDLIAQQRIGALRSGKGDALNTGFRYFLAGSWSRLHFYDADIKSFHRGWIDQAEQRLDQGFDTTRFFFPRARTDGMVTWMITRPGFALLWPDSVLSRIRQPLAGEVAFSREAVLGLVSEAVVTEQSDWGIDAALLHRTAGLGLSIYECYAPEGKDHALYGTLADLETMLAESINVLQRLRASSPPLPAAHQADETAQIESAVLDQVAFDRAGTAALLQEPWDTEAVALLTANFGDPLASQVLRWEDELDLTSLDPRGWIEVLTVLLDRFDHQSVGWRQVAFRLWAGRVLHHAKAVESLDYWQAMSRLEEQVTIAHK